MALEYRVFGNGGTGGPVDFSTPLVTVAGLSWSSAALAPGSWRFAVRAHDTVTGLESLNTDSTVLLVGPTGADLTAAPGPVQGLHAFARGSSTLRVQFGRPAGRPATGYRIWATPGGTVNWAAPPALILAEADAPGPLRFADLTGLTAGTTYAVGVAAYSAVGQGPGVAVAATTATAAAPAAVAAGGGSSTWRA